MYILDPGVKQDPVRRCSLPHWLLFSCGACPILAYAFLKAYPESGFCPIWSKPAAGFTGNHIVVVCDAAAFDYHGFSKRSRLLKHDVDADRCLVRSSDGVVRPLEGQKAEDASVWRDIAVMKGSPVEMKLWFDPARCQESYSALTPDRNECPQYAWSAAWRRGPGWLRGCRRSSTRLWRGRLRCAR